MYTIVNLGLTDGQKQALLQGVAIKITPAQFSGSVPVPLTKTQAANIASAKRSITLKMSGPQQKLLQRIQLEGEGFLDDLKKAGLSLARKGVEKGLDYLQSRCQLRSSALSKEWVMPWSMSAAKALISWSIAFSRNSAAMRRSR